MGRVCLQVWLGLGPLTSSLPWSKILDIYRWNFDALYHISRDRYIFPVLAAIVISSCRLVVAIVCRHRLRARRTRCGRQPHIRRRTFNIVCHFFLEILAFTV